jgi:hypothetical protein
MLETVDLEPKGIGGWLAVFIASLIVLGTIYSCAFWTGVTDADFKGFWFFLLLFFIMAILAFLSAYQLIFHQRSGVIFSKILISANFVLWVTMIPLIPEIVLLAIVAFVYAVISWLYLDSSKRVRNTYGLYLG